MQVINILKRTEYLLCLLLFLLIIFTIIFSQDYVQEHILVNIFKFNLYSEFIYYFYCIFLESQFESDYFKLLQIRFERRLFFVTIMVNISTIINTPLYFIFPAYHLNYINANKKYRKNINSEKRCELYNINESNAFPYHYICSYNPENEILPNHLKSIYNFIPVFNCSDFKLLINNNKVIKSFIQKYKTNQIYQCDSKDRTKNLIFFRTQNYYDLCVNLIFILTMVYIFLSVKYLELVNVYFKNIKANIINMVIIDY